MKYTITNICINKVRGKFFFGWAYIQVCYSKINNFRLTFVFYFFLLALPCIETKMKQFFFDISSTRWTSFVLFSVSLKLNFLHFVSVDASHQIMRSRVICEFKGFNHNQLKHVLKYLAWDFYNIEWLVSLPSSESDHWTEPTWFSFWRIVILD